MRKLAIIGLALLTAGALPAKEQPKLAVHEWGTFTALQDERGQAIGGINDDVEPLPQFVYTMGGRNKYVTGKGAPISQDVIMRLETPVLYFHLRDDVRTMKLDVRESFRGGWLTQYYPEAAADAPGFGSPGIHISPETMGSLTWEDLELGTGSAGPETTSPVWLAPRNVAAADVRNAKGETERFLFDRGVGNIDAPIRVSRTGGTLEIRSQIEPVIAADARPLDVAKMWLLDVRKDGSRAFRTVDAVRLTSDHQRILATVKADFEEKEYGKDLQPLMDSMHAELVRGGLNADEADAMLNTWRTAYFQSMGERVLFLTPRAWADYYLPLEISKPAEVTRVMMARVELVTPRERELVKKSVSNHQDLEANAELNRWRFAGPLTVAQWIRK